MDDNIKMYLMGDMDLILLALDGEPWRALVNTVMNLRVPFVEWLSSCWLLKGYSAPCSYLCNKGR
jgi:hypothetical protein